MRVALVYKRLSDHGGSERQVSMHARELAARGHDVTVICAQQRTAAPDGVTVHAMPVRVPGDLTGLLAFSSWARRCARRTGPYDVTHAFGRTVGQDVYRVGGGCHRTYLEHAHDLDRPAWRRALSARMPAEVVKAALEQRALTADTTRAIITNSAMVRDDLAFRYAIPEARFTVVRNGVDLTRFAPLDDAARRDHRRALELPEHGPVVAFVGTGYARKGLGALLRALPGVRARHPDVVVLVAGRDGRPARWRALADALGVARHVRWLGGRDDPDVIAGIADVTVLPTAYDPAANGTLESLAVGTPTVTSTMNGSAEIVDDDVGSVVPAPVSPHDVEAATCAWLDRRGDRDAIVERARAQAELHPIEHSCVRMLEVYRAVLDGSATGAPSSPRVHHGTTS